MQKIKLLAFSLVLGAGAYAQTIKVPVGKKFEVATDSKMTITMSAMGQEMNIENNGINVADYELKAVTNTGYTLVNTIRHVEGSISAGGEEQTFDSDDETIRANPQYAEAFKMLNKTNEVVVENGVATAKGELGSIMGASGVSSGDLKKYFITIKDADFKQDFRWKDSSNANGATSVNEYVITRVSDTEVDVTVNTQSAIKGTVSQGGMEVKQDLKGTVAAKRTYNKTTGMLVTEQSTVTMSGNMEMMGQNAPLTMKGSSTITVK